MKELYGKEVPLWLRAIGAWRVNKDSVDFRWGYFAPRFGLEFTINRGGYFSNRYSIDFCFLWGKFNVKLPFKTRLGMGCSMPIYGFYVFGNQLVLATGGEFDESIGQVTNGGTKHFDIPFVTWVFDGHWILDKQCEYRKIEKSESAWEVREHEAHKDTYGYEYTLKSGEVQERLATCTTEKRVWHRKWLPFLKTERVVINVEFDKEVGEKSGTWKGGVLGCDYEKLPNETVKQCLARMERDRIFD